MPAKKKKTRKKKKAVAAANRVKHIKVSFLNEAANLVSVRIGQTLGQLMEARGISNQDFTEILGVKRNSSTQLTPPEIIDGYEEIVFVPTGGGGR